MAEDRIWVGRSISGTMLWVFDPDFPHPEKTKVFGFALVAGEMREYLRSVVSNNLRELTGDGRNAAVAEYLRWKEDKGKLFANEVTVREKAAEEEEKRREREVAIEREQRLSRIRDMMRKIQKRDSVAIKKAVEDRQIPFLVHFTRLENLGGILDKGILPVSSLGGVGHRNDSMRLDGFPEAASLSVSFPNYLMFYRYRCLSPDANWAVVTVSSEALIEIPCLFFPSNAANGRFRGLGEQSLEALMGIDGFSDMFSDNPLGSRHDRGLPERATTDPQAEVLAFEPIPPAMILGVRLLRPDQDAAKAVCRLLPSSTMMVGGKLFEPRADWRHWQSSAKNDSAIPHPEGISF